MITHISIAILQGKICFGCRKVMFKKNQVKFSLNASILEIKSENVCHRWVSFLNQNLFYLQLPSASERAIIALLLQFKEIELLWRCLFTARRGVLEKSFFKINFIGLIFEARNEKLKSFGVILLLKKKKSGAKRERFFVHISVF